MNFKRYHCWNYLYMLIGKMQDPDCNYVMMEVCLQLASLPTCIIHVWNITRVGQAELLERQLSGRFVRSNQVQPSGPSC